MRRLAGTPYETTWVSNRGRRETCVEWPPKTFVVFGPLPADAQRNRHPRGHPEGTLATSKAKNGRVDNPDE
jgi:hypothetical protein